MTDLKIIVFAVHNFSAVQRLHCGCAISVSEKGDNDKLRLAFERCASLTTREAAGAGEGKSLPLQNFRNHMVLLTKL